MKIDYFSLVKTYEYLLLSHHIAEAFFRRKIQCFHSYIVTLQKFMQFIKFAISSQQGPLVATMNRDDMNFVGIITFPFWSFGTLQ